LVLDIIVVCLPQPQVISVEVDAAGTMLNLIGTHVYHEIEGHDGPVDDVLLRRTTGYLGIAGCTMLMGGCVLFTRIRRFRYVGIFAG
jgi:hypothetical protein